MRLRELYESATFEPTAEPALFTSQSPPTPPISLPVGVNHTLPHTVIFPDMDGYYEFYRFVIAMSAYPNIDTSFYKTRQLRDIPIAVAYSDSEFEVMKAVAEKFGKKWEEMTIGASHEPPGSNTVSPVMKFHMTENHIDIMKALLEAMENDKD